MGTRHSGNFYQLPPALHQLSSLRRLDVSSSRYAALSKADTKWINATLTSLKANNNPWNCACRNIDFITWFQLSQTVISDDVTTYNCSTCDECDALPTSLANFSYSHCSVSPKQEHTKVLRYGLGLAFCGLVVGVLLTSCVVFVMSKRRVACFKPPYENLDETSTNA